MRRNFCRWIEPPLLAHIRLQHKVLHIFALFFACAAHGQEVPGSFLIAEGSKRINGVQLYYKTMGQGDPVVIVHGGPGLDHSYFLPSMGRLSSRHQLIFFDQRASGRSGIPKDTAGMAFGRFIDDLEGIRRAFGIERMNLLAHSWGSVLALRYALRYPGHLKSLILVAPNPASSSYFGDAREALRRRTSRSDSIAIAKLMQSDRMARRTPGAMEDLFRLTFRAMVYKKEDADKLVLSFPRDYALRNSLLMHLGPEANRYDLHADLASLSVPTFIVAGEADVMPPEALQRLHEGISGSQLAVIRNCGHFPFLEQPDEFFPAVFRFLRKHR